MLDLLLYAIIISLKITAIHVCFWEGMIFGWLRIIIANVFDKRFGLTASRYIQKPLWDCLMCMASVWTIIIMIVDAGTFSYFNWLDILYNILIVCGLLCLIDTVLPKMCSHPEQEEYEGI